MRLVVLPQATRRVTPALLNDFVALQKDCGLISVLGAVDAVRAAGVASVVFFTLRFREATSTWLTQAARTHLAGGAGSWLGNNYQPDSPFKDSVWRQQKGALWDIGPHALSLFLPALGPVTAVQAGAGLGDTVHLVLAHASGAASTVTLSHTVAPMSAGIEFFVHGDAGLLRLVFQNLLANAFKYAGTTRDTMIRVAGEQHEGRVRFSIRDNGPGVPPSERESVFGVMVRGSDRSGAEVDGLGIGLATCRRIAQAHGGAVGVTEAPGGGAEFWFELPSE